VADRVADRGVAGEFQTSNSEGGWKFEVRSWRCGWRFELRSSRIFEDRGAAGDSKFAARLS
jgi:hypothetical protein